MKVSRSGMSRNIRFYMLGNDKRLVNVSYQIAQALEWGHADGFDGGVKVGGCGMDMVFHTVYTLSRVMGFGEMNQNEMNARRKGLRLQTI